MNIMHLYKILLETKKQIKTHKTRTINLNNIRLWAVDNYFL